MVAELKVAKSTSVLPLDLGNDKIVAIKVATSSIGLVHMSFLVCKDLAIGTLPTKIEEKKGMQQFAIEEDSIEAKYVMEENQRLFLKVVSL